VTLSAGQRTCDLQVACSIPGSAPLYKLYFAENGSKSSNLNIVALGNLFTPMCLCHQAI